MNVVTDSYDHSTDEFIVLALNHRTVDRKNRLLFTCFAYILLTCFVSLDSRPIADFEIAFGDSKVVKNSLISVMKM